MSKIQLRRGTAAQWTSADPVLSSGEVGFETDTSKFKIGDGSTVWSGLAYFVGSGITAVVEDTTPQLGGNLDTNGHQIQWSKGADVASASALPIGTDGNYYDVTGNETITSINTTGKVGTPIKLHFDAILILTHHATDLVLPTGANITTQAGDEVEFLEYASGDFRCTSYLRADGTALVGASPDATITADTSTTISLANALGNYCNMGSANATTTYTTTGAVDGGWSLVFVNAASEPDITATSATTAGSFIIGRTYKIASIGTTDFTLIGASANTVGLNFVATGVGTGTGTATLNAIKEHGNVFYAGTDMYMRLYYDGTNVKYSFLRKDVLNNADNLQKEITDNYVLTSADNGYLIKCNSATAKNITVNDNLSDNFECSFWNKGAGAWTFIEGTAIFDDFYGTILETKKACYLFKDGSANSYVLTGNLTT